jgi:hypothetical protein
LNESRGFSVYCDAGPALPGKEYVGTLLKMGSIQLPSKVAPQAYRLSLSTGNRIGTGFFIIRGAERRLKAGSRTKPHKTMKERIN